MIPFCKHPSFALLHILPIMLSHSLHPTHYKAVCDKNLKPKSFTADKTRRWSTLQVWRPTLWSLVPLRDANSFLLSKQLKTLHIRELSKTDRLSSLEQWRWHLKAPWSSNFLTKSSTGLPNAVWNQGLWIKAMPRIFFKHCTILWNTACCAEFDKLHITL